MKMTISTLVLLLINPILWFYRTCLWRSCSGQTATSWSTASATGPASTPSAGSSTPSSPPKTIWTPTRRPSWSWATSGTCATGARCWARRAGCWPSRRTATSTRSRPPRTTTACWWCFMGWWTGWGTPSWAPRGPWGSGASWRACRPCLPADGQTPSSERRSYDRLNVTSVRLTGPHSVPRVSRVTVPKVAMTSPESETLQKRELHFTRNCVEKKNCGDEIKSHQTLFDLFLGYSTSSS